jgi:hypothetical protein
MAPWPSSHSSHFIAARHLRNVICVRLMRLNPQVDILKILTRLKFSISHHSGYGLT